ncbi:hypothetical protein [Mycobacteroides chelonae]|uniref:hypothetical protein n=1 Tax=Mycobacteroides chelonae TaxID=1774 RepID=UPI003AAADF84
MSDPDGWSRQIPGWNTSSAGASSETPPGSVFVSSALSGAPPEEPKRNRRWGWVLALVLVAVLAIAAGAWFFRSDERGGDVAGVVGTPDSLMLSEPMDRQPVSGWHLSVAAEVSPDVESLRLVGSNGDNAVFLTYDRKDVASPQTRIFAVDVMHGQLVAPAVTLPKVDDCWLNGPPVVLCIGGTNPASAPPNPQAWVVDSGTGQLLHSGPTDMRFLSAKREVRQVGQYAVETVPGVGVYGIGGAAEHTWFVPGDGSAAVGETFSPDVPPPVLAEQGAQTRVVFSVVDGHVVTPTPRSPGDRSSKAQPSTGGMAVLMKADKGGNYVVVIDNQGKVTGTFAPPEFAVDLDSGSSETPVVRTGTGSSSQWVPISGAGRALLNIPSVSLVTEFRTIGDRILVSPQPFSGQSENWDQYDLLTGKKLSTCTIPGLVLSHGGNTYIGFNGTTVVTTAGKAISTNLDTCQRQEWDFGGDSKFQKVNRTLIRFEGSEIFSLVAPK